MHARGSNTRSANFARWVQARDGILRYRQPEPAPADLYDIVGLLHKGVVEALAVARRSVARYSQLSPKAMAYAAIVLLRFAEFDSRTGGERPSVADSQLPGSMQLAACGAAMMRSLADRLDDESAHIVREHDDFSIDVIPLLITEGLVHLLIWLAQPTTPVATASAVLAEALDGLKAVMAACLDMKHVLASERGGMEWAPVAKALRRRLPRRMAARFLPDVDNISDSVMGGVNAGAEAEIADAVLDFVTALTQVSPALLAIASVI